MISTLHGQVTLHSNVLSDVRIAKEAGYEAVEIHTEKLSRFLNAGRTPEELRDALNSTGMQVAAIDIIGDIEAVRRESREQLMAETRRLCEVAAVIGAPTIQVNAFCGLDGLDIQKNIEITALNLREIADIGAAYNVRFQIEGAAWTPIHSLQDCLNLIEETGRDNVGMVIDFWHFWASRGAEPEDIAKLDSEIIYTVHMCDGYRPEPGQPWPDETELRNVLPGEGHLPVNEWMEAIKTTGFNGFISGEFLNPELWERDHLEVAKALRAAMESFL